MSHLRKTMGLLLLPVGVLAEEFTFTFGFPDMPYEYVMRQTTKRVRTMEGQGSVEDESFAELKMSVVSSENGFTITATPLEAEMKRGGQVLRDPVTQALLSASLTYHVAADGHMVSIEGYEKIVSDLLAQAPPEYRDQLKQALSPEAMKARDTAEWEGRYGVFAGQTANTEEAWESESPYTLPNGQTIDFFTVYTFPRTLPCGDGATCVEIVTHYSSDATALAEYSASVVAAVGEAESAEEPMTAGAGSIEGESTRLMEPATMRIHREVLQRTITMTLDVPGQGAVPVRTEETRTYEFEYPPSE